MVVKRKNKLGNKYYYNDNTHRFTSESAWKTSKTKARKKIEIEEVEEMIEEEIAEEEEVRETVREIIEEIEPLPDELEFEYEEVEEIEY